MAEECHLSCPSCALFTFSPERWQVAYLKCQSQVQLSAGKCIGRHRKRAADIVFQFELSAPDNGNALTGAHIAYLPYYTFAEHWAQLQLLLTTKMASFHFLMFAFPFLPLKQEAPMKNVWLLFCFYSFISLFFILLAGASEHNKYFDSLPDAADRKRYFDRWIATVVVSKKQRKEQERNNIKVWAASLSKTV